MKHVMPVLLALAAPETGRSAVAAVELSLPSAGAWRERHQLERRQRPVINLDTAAHQL